VGWSDSSVFGTRFEDFEFTWDIRRRIGFNARYANLHKQTWLEPGNFHEMRGPRTLTSNMLDQELEFSITTSAKELEENLDDVAGKVLKTILFSSNQSDLVSDESAVERYIRMGREFNGH
jgi:hypothetical protein